MKEVLDIVVLARVIDRKSFARAAADLGMPPSTASRRIAGLERRLGVRVLERTTRSLRPTEVGELLAERGRRVSAELAEAERVVSDHQQTPRGVLRISLPTPTASDLLGPALAEYLRRYPDVKLEVVADDEIVDLLEGGYDGAIRLARQPDSGLGTIRLGTVRPVLAASRAYLERARPLRHPRELAGHPIVAFATKRRVTWKFVRAASETAIELVPRAVANSAPVVAQLCAAGAGLALLPRFTAAAASLSIVEPGGWRPLALEFSIVTPSARSLAPKLRAFVELLYDFVASRPDVFDSVVPRRRP